MPREAYPMGPFECGLFCCIPRHKQEIGLWNFATRDYKILPQLKPDSSWSSFGVGLGLDRKSNYDKLVCTMAIFDYDQNDVLKSSDSNQVAIYSFNTNSWRNFQSLKKTRFEIKHPDYKVILLFDMSDEVFQEIQPPECRFESPVRWPCKALRVQNDSLSYLIFDEKKNCYDIWIMNKEGHNYNWTKQFTVTAPFVANDEELEAYEVHGFWKNGAFLFAITDEGRIFLYDPTAEKKFKDLQLDDDITTASIYLYKESLFNVKCEGLFALLY